MPLGKAIKNHEGTISPSAAAIEFDRVTLRFGSRSVFDDLSCRFPKARVSILVGSSGCGKSSLLRLIGGLIRPQSGSIRIIGSEVVGISEKTFSGVRSHIGMMFQNGALLNSMTLFQNLALPLHEHSKLRESEITARVQEQLSAVGLGDAGALLPNQLSGGMVKRAALARALITDPEILLCDEPFSGLDPISVRRIESLLMDVNRNHQMTLILTSHHVPSTMRMANQVIFLIDGAAIAGTPAELMKHPDVRISEFWVEHFDHEESAFKGDAP